MSHGMPYAEYVVYRSAGNPTLGQRSTRCEQLRRLLTFFAGRQSLASRSNASASGWDDVDHYGPGDQSIPGALTAGNAQGAAGAAGTPPIAESDFHFGIVPANDQQRQIAVTKFREMAAAIGMSTSQRVDILARFPELFGLSPATLRWTGIPQGTPRERNTWVEQFERQYAAATAGAAGGAAAA